MNFHVNELLSFSEQLSCEDCDGGGAVSNFLVLGFGDIDEDLGSRVVDVHRSEDGGAIVGDVNMLVLGSGCDGN